MSTSLLYHAFGLTDCQYQATNFIDSNVYFKVSLNKRLIRCPECRHRKVTIKEFIPRTIKTIPIGKKSVFIQLDIPRVYCLKCLITRQVKLPFARPHSRYTRSFERMVIQLSNVMTMKHIAQWLKVGWDVVKNIIKRRLKQVYNKPKLVGLKRIAIDEIYLGKSQGFMTIVLDLVTGRVVYTALGKHSEALNPFWLRLKHNKIKIDAVATDMGAAYIKAVRENIPEAILVFDHFHIIKLFNEKLTRLRRDLFNDLECAEEKKALKGTRWLLLKRPDNLKDNSNERQRLEHALEINKPLSIAYYLKEDLAQIWRQESKEEAEAWLNEWASKAQASGVNILQKFAKKLLLWRRNILAYYDTNKLSTGPLEGVNNKIKTLKRMAYGYRDQEFFQLKILALHESKSGLHG